MKDIINHKPNCNKHSRRTLLINPVIGMRCSSCKAETKPIRMYQPGLKDHEIQELVTAIKEKTKRLIPHGCLREVISSSVTGYLEKKNLRIDK